MLFAPQGYPRPVRLQEAFVSNEEADGVIGFLRNNSNEEDSVCKEIMEKIDSISESFDTISYDEAFFDGGLQEDDLDEDMRDESLIREGIRQGKSLRDSEKISEMLKRGKTPEAIEEFCGYPMDQIVGILEELKEGV